MDRGGAAVGALVAPAGGDDLDRPSLADECGRQGADVHGRTFVAQDRDARVADDQGDGLGVVAARHAPRPPPGRHDAHVVERAQEDVAGARQAGEIEPTGRCRRGERVPERGSEAVRVEGIGVDERDETELRTGVGRG